MFLCATVCLIKSSLYCACFGLSSPLLRFLIQILSPFPSLLFSVRLLSLSSSLPSLLFCFLHFTYPASYPSLLSLSPFPFLFFPFPFLSFPFLPVTSLFLLYLQITSFFLFLCIVMASYTYQYFKNGPLHTDRKVVIEHVRTGRTGKIK